MKRPLRQLVFSVVASLALSCHADTVINERSGKAAEMMNGDLVSATYGPNEKEFVANLEAFDSNRLQLGIVPTTERYLPIKALVRNQARIFNVGHLWEPPRQCLEISDNRATCSNAAERVYCNDVLYHLDRLYCQLGGESRTMSSYLGRSMTAGDLVVLWRFASDVCSLRRAPNANNPSQRIDESVVAERIGLAVNQAKGYMADRLLEKFLGLGQEDSQWESKRRFIVHDLLKAISEDEVYPATNQGRRELWQDVSAACLYLAVHRKQVTY